MKRIENIFTKETLSSVTVSNGTSSVVIEKSTGSVKNISTGSKEGTLWKGIVGLINGKNGRILVLVKGAEQVGSILGRTLYRLTEVGFIDFSSSAQTEAYSMVNDFLSHNQVYYSLYDLSNTLQDNADASFPLPSLSTVNSEYCWNFEMASELKESSIAPVFLVNGYVSSSEISDYPSNFNFILLTRKQNLRSGMRFQVRGVDANGDVANFAENEQILEIEEGDTFTLSSFLQIRGSIPCYWSQEPCMIRNPTITLEREYEDNLESFNAHLAKTGQKYGKIVQINLIDKKKDQKVIGDLFSNLAEEGRKKTDSDYIWFDFHKECKGMKYENIKILLNDSQFQGNLGVIEPTKITVKQGVSEVEHRQKGVLRTNCIDCLDRTNVVMSVFGRKMLQKGLFDNKMVPSIKGEPFEQLKGAAEMTFKRMWADNGDSMSNAYTSTGAMKADFTRTGKRTIGGALQDGQIAIKRFFVNNFYDGYKQDCHDVFLGKLNLRKDILTPHTGSLFIAFTALCLVLSLFLYRMTVSFAFNDNSSSLIKAFFLKLIFFVVIILAVFVGIFSRSKERLLDKATINRIHPK